MDFSIYFTVYEYDIGVYVKRRLQKMRLRLLS